MTEEMIIALIGYAVKYGIPAVMDLIDTWNKPTPTLEDWKAAFAKAKTYEEYTGTP